MRLAFERMVELAHLALECSEQLGAVRLGCLAFANSEQLVFANLVEQLGVVRFGCLARLASAHSGQLQPEHLMSATLLSQVPSPTVCHRQDKTTYLLLALFHNTYKMP